MVSKKKIIIPFIAMAAIIVGLLISTALVFASTRQSVTSNIRITYTATEIDGKVQATYTIGNTSRYLVAKDGTTEIRFYATESQDNYGVLNFPIDDIKLTSINNFIVLRYIFTNYGDVEYTAVMTYNEQTLVNNNMNMEFSIDGITYGETQYGLVVKKGEEKSYYIKISINKLENNASFETDFAWRMENYEPSEGEELIDLSKMNFALNADNLTYSVSYNGSNLSKGILYIPSHFGTSSVIGVTNNPNLTEAQKQIVKKVVIPSGITTIAESAFEGLTNLLRVEFTQNVTSHIVGVTSIGANAFKGCTSLTEITIPNTVTMLSSSSFSGCLALSKVVFAEGTTFENLDLSTFNGLASNLEVYINDISLVNAFTSISTANVSVIKLYVKNTVDASILLANGWSLGSSSIANYRLYTATGTAA